MPNLTEIKGLVRIFTPEPVIIHVDTNVYSEPGKKHTIEEAQSHVISALIRCIQSSQTEFRSIKINDDWYDLEPKIEYTQNGRRKYENSDTN